MRFGGGFGNRGGIGGGGADDDDGSDEPPEPPGGSQQNITAPADDGDTDDSGGDPAPEPDPDSEPRIVDDGDDDGGGASDEMQRDQQASRRLGGSGDPDAEPAPDDTAAADQQASRRLGGSGDPDAEPMDEPSRNPDRGPSGPPNSRQSGGGTLTDQGLGEADALNEQQPDSQPRDQGRLEELSASYRETVTEPAGELGRKVSPVAPVEEAVLGTDTTATFNEAAFEGAASVGNLPQIALDTRSGVETLDASLSRGFDPVTIGGVPTGVTVPDIEGRQAVAADAGNAAAQTAAAAAANPVETAGLIAGSAATGFGASRVGTSVARGARRLDGSTTRRFVSDERAQAGGGGRQNVDTVDDVTTQQTTRARQSQQRDVETGAELDVEQLEQLDPADLSEGERELLEELGVDDAVETTDDVAETQQTTQTAQTATAGEMTGATTGVATAADQSTAMTDAVLAGADTEATQTEVVATDVDQDTLTIAGADTDTTTDQTEDVATDQTTDTVSDVTTDTTTDTTTTTTTTETTLETTTELTEPTKTTEIETATVDLSSDDGMRRLRGPELDIDATDELGGGDGDEDAFAFRFDPDTGILSGEDI